MIGSKTFRAAQNMSRSVRLQRIAQKQQSVLKPASQMTSTFVQPQAVQVGGLTESLKDVLFSEPMQKSTTNIVNALINDCTNRYQAAKLTDTKSEKVNYLLLSEMQLAEYFGVRYGLGLNSGGMAIMLGLLAIARVSLKGVPPAECRCYSNSFTFNAVPSAIHNSGMQAVLIETAPDLTIDLDDLESQLKKDFEGGHKGKMVLALSYMRGRVPNMDKVLQLCDKYETVLLEDNAHGYGCEWKGQKVGSFGVVSTISTQSNKLINTGEGGYVFTNSPEMMSYFMYASGCYEGRFSKHEEMCPPRDVLEDFRFSVANYSCRMTNIQGGLVCEQINVLQQRIDAHNAGYELLQEYVDEFLPEGGIEFIPQLDEVTAAYDSLQVRIKYDGEGEHPLLDEYVDTMAKSGYEMQKFHDYENARFYRSWGFLKNTRDLPITERVLHNVLDVRLSCTDTEEDIKNMASALTSCYKNVFEG